MPSKKKKYNARFPPARIKKIMQKDEEVGKVAAAVPVIISRALELFIENLITKASETTQARRAKTLSTSHIKQVVLSEQQFDFLKDLVASVPDVQAEEEDTIPTTGVSNISISTRGRGRGRGRGRPRTSSRDTTSNSLESMDNGDTDDTEETDTGEEEIEIEESSSSSLPAAAGSAQMAQATYSAAMSHPATLASYPSSADVQAQPIDMTSSASTVTRPGASITQPFHMPLSVAAVPSSSEVTQPLNMTGSASMVSHPGNMVTPPVNTNSHLVSVHPAQMPPAPYTLPVRPPVQAVPFINNNPLHPHYYTPGAAVYGHPSSILLQPPQAPAPSGNSGGKQPLVSTTSSNNDDYDS